MFASLPAKRHIWKNHIMLISMTLLKKHQRLPLTTQFFSATWKFYHPENVFNLPLSYLPVATANGQLRRREMHQVRGKIGWRGWKLGNNYFFFRLGLFHGPFSRGRVKPPQGKYLSRRSNRRDVCFTQTTGNFMDSTF